MTQQTRSLLLAVYGAKFIAGVIVLTLMILSHLGWL